MLWEFLLYFSFRFPSSIWMPKHSSFTQISGFPALPTCTDALAMFLEPWGLIRLKHGSTGASGWDWEPHSSRYTSVPQVGLPIQNCQVLTARWTAAKGECTTCHKYQKWQTRIEGHMYCSSHQLHSPLTIKPDPGATSTTTSTNSKWQFLVGLAWTSSNRPTTTSTIPSMSWQTQEQMTNTRANDRGLSIKAIMLLASQAVNTTLMGE